MREEIKHICWGKTHTHTHRKSRAMLRKWPTVKKRKTEKCD